ELNVETPIALLSIEFPDLMAVKVEAGEFPGADEDVDVLAVGRGRRRGGVTFIRADPARGRAQLAFPQFLAIGADTEQDSVLVVLAGQKDVLVPDAGRGTAHAQHLEFPGDVPGCCPLVR